MTRCLLVGCGGISRAWLNVIRDLPGIEVAGFVDLNPGAARERAAEAGVPGALTGSDLAAALSAV